MADGPEAGLELVDSLADEPTERERDLSLERARAAALRRPDDSG